MERARGLVSLMLPLLLLIACQSGSAPPEVLSFTADPSTVHPGEASTLRWSVRGADSITLDPGGTDVSSLNTKTVHPAATTTYTLTAVSAAGSDGGSVTVTVDTSIDVQGTVLGLDGRPAIGVEVVVLGGGRTTTGAGGSFTLPGVLPPYTVHLVHPSESLVVTYVDLTAVSPVLILSGLPVGGTHQTSIFGTVSAGTGFPQPAGHVTQVGIASDATRFTVTADPTSGAYQMLLLPWFGTTTEATIHALQWQMNTSGLPVAFIGHGQRDLTLRPTTLAYLAQDVALLPVGESSVSGRVEVPPGYTFAGRAEAVVFPEGGMITTAAELFPPSTFSYITPTIPDVTIAVMAVGAAPGGEATMAVRAGLPTTASNVTVTVPSVPELTAPIDGANDVGYETEFSWTAPSGGVAVATFNGGAGEPSYAIVTDATHASIPDLRELGIGFSAGTTYHWQVASLPVYATVDDAVVEDDGLLSSWYLNALFLPKHDGAWAASKQRTATTIP